MFSKLQEKIVTKLISSINSKWDRVTADIEIDYVCGEIVMSPNFRHYNGNEYTQFSSGIEITDLFEELRNLMKEYDQHNRAWTVIYLEIDYKGKYLFEFSYDEPPRLTKLKNA